MKKQRKKGLNDTRAEVVSKLEIAKAKYKKAFETGEWSDVKSAERSMEALERKLYSGDYTSLNDGLEMKKGVDAFKQKDTWKDIGALAGGSVSANVGGYLLNIPAPDSASVALKSGLNALAAGAIAVASMGLGYKKFGIGAGMVAIKEAIDTLSGLLTQKTFADNIAGR